MNKKSGWIIGIALVIIIVVVLLLTLGGNKTPSTNNQSDNPSVISNPGGESTLPTTTEPVTVEITSSGFSPNEISLLEGTQVIFVNKDTVAHWPASASHPTHTVYAGGDYDAEGSYGGSQACVSEGQAKEGAFDACKGIAPGENWSFTFNQVGSWAYHDHLNARLFGKVNVIDSSEELPAN